MQGAPYSIYINKRPLRIAFLMGSNDFNPQQLDAIYAYNRGKWGGRFNPIILTDGKTIEKKRWKFLRDVDPDVIVSLVPLQDELLKKIESFLSPYLVEVPGNIDKDKPISIHLSQEGLSILPTSDNVAKVSGSLAPGSRLVLFDLDETEDEVVRQFVNRNFGTYAHALSIQSSLGENEKRAFRITTRESLASALVELSSYERFTYPIQICSLPNTLRDVVYDPAGEHFTVVVGDSPEDIICSWNRTLFIPPWKRTGLSQIWIPTTMANDTKLERALGSWLRKAADPAGTSGKTIQFVSYSLTKAELDEIADRLRKNTYLIKSITIYDEPQTPHFQPNVFGPRLRRNMDLYRATGDKESVVLREPHDAQGAAAGQYWMADVYIQFRPERYANVIGRELWWQLPPRNHLAHLLFRRRARIGSDGFPCVLMTRAESTLSIKLPDDLSILRALMVGKNIPAYARDPRKKIVHRPFDHCQPSTSGQYLSGLLDLFSGLSYACQVLEHRYWRHMFSILSHQDPSKDEKRRISIRNKLRKKLQSYGADFPTKAEGLEWLSEYVLQLSKEQAATGREQQFKVFVDEARNEFVEFNSSRQQGEEFDFSEKDLKEALSDLTGSNVLLMGVRSHCSRCGHTNWYHVDETRQILRCKGCGHEYPLRPEEEWYYKLNSLVETGYVQHGLVPVILVLGQLSNESMSSFIMAPNLDLFKEREKKPIGELDIVCIQDGRLIIGEVKQSVKLFRRSNFDTMAEIAERIRPNELIFSSLDQEPSKLVDGNMANIRTRLSPLGIEVRWYQLHPFVFEASPFW